jgi:hypothetical protein
MGENPETASGQNSSEQTEQEAVLRQIEFDAKAEAQQRQVAKRYQPGHLRAFLQIIRREVDGDADLVKQSLADLNAMDRQNLQTHSEARREYIKQVAELDRVAQQGIREYGLQTLKWLFLLNAGAIAIILAYLGGASGRAVGQPVILSPLLKALWPFITGCVLVAAAGAAGYFNFCYMVASLPSPEASASVVFFGYGAFLMLRIALRGLGHMDDVLVLRHASKLSATGIPSRRRN